MLAFVLASLAAALGVNTWNKYFFDALEKKDIRGDLLGIALIFGIAFASAAVAVVLIHLRMRLQVRWRQWLARP